MVVGCPKCKAKLKVPDNRIKPEGTKFKCPKCSALLMVRPPRKSRPAPVPPPVPPPVRERPAPAPIPEPGSPFGEPASAPPAMPERSWAPEPPRPAPTPEPEPEPEPDGPVVLIANSNPTALSMLKYVLTAANYRVLTATDGATAMVLAQREKPAALVTDVSLPRIHGIEVTKRLKAGPDTSAMKIILSGGKAESEVRNLFGADAYIQQDRIQNTLTALIASVLERSTTAEAMAPPKAVPETPTEPWAAPAPAATPAPSRPAPTPPPTSPGDMAVERAKRLSRTVLADIDLYNPEKVNRSIKAGNF